MDGVTPGDSTELVAKYTQKGETSLFRLLLQSHLIDGVTADDYTKVVAKYTQKDTKS